MSPNKQINSNNAEEKRTLLHLLRSFREGDYYPVVYMFLVTAFFCAILIAVADATRERVEANRRIKFERAVMMAVFPGEITRETSPMKVHKKYTERVEGDKGRESEVIRITQNGELIGYALKFSGQGFWDTIKGVLAMHPDGRRIRGVAFYQQEETPGLGAKITTREFRKQFKDLRLKTGTPPLLFRSPGMELKRGEVHAITGATQTSVRVEDLLNRRLKKWLRSTRKQEKQSQGDGSA